MHTVAGNELAQVRAQLVVRVHGNVVELVHGNQSVVELLHAELIDGEAERRMSANENLVVAFQKCADGVHLAAIVATRGVAEIPSWLYAPVGPKAELDR